MIAAAASAGAADQGQPYRGAPPLRARRGYIFQAADGRVVFALPFAQDFTLIGTTDENFAGDRNSPAPDAGEILYLCEAVNDYFRDKITPDDWCGRLPACVRSMTTAPASRRSHARLHADARREAAVRRRCSPSMAARSPPTAGWPRRRWRGSAIFSRRCRPGPRSSHLPGGDFPPDGFYADGGRNDRAAGRSSPSRMRGGWCAPMARAPSASSATRQASTISARASPAISPAPKCATDRKRMGADRRRRAVAAKQVRAYGHRRGARARSTRFMAVVDGEKRGNERVLMV